MSIYTVNEICYRCVHDPPFRERLRSAPESALAELDLSTEEREALLRADVAALFRMGAHAFLLGHLARYGIFGLDQMAYNERIRSALDAS